MADEITSQDISKMKVADLKKELKERGLTSSGSKSELVARLVTTLSESDSSIKATDIENVDADLSESVLTEEESLVLNETGHSMAQTPEKVVTEVVKEEEPPRQVTVHEPEDEDITKTTEPKKLTMIPTPESDRIKKRAERFGVVNEDLKKQARAERFGISAGDKGSGANVDVLKKRAERFGQTVSSTLSKEEDSEKIRKRKERFGDVITTTTNNSPSPKYQKITFDSNEVDEAKKKRATRFGMTS